MFSVVLFFEIPVFLGKKGKIVLNEKRSRGKTPWRTEYECFTKELSAYGSTLLGAFSAEEKRPGKSEKGALSSSSWLTRNIRPVSLLSLLILFGVVTLLQGFP